MSRRLEYLGSGTFAENAVSLWHRGFSPIPTQGKVPAVAGYYDRKYRYSETTIVELAIQMPEANVAYQPGLSIPAGDEEYRLLVLDCDDLHAAEQIKNLFGETSGTWTSRGYHGIYKIHFTEVDEITRLVGAGGDLRRFALNVDVKHGSSIVMAGGSWHPDGTQYKWDGPDVHGDRVGDGFLANARALDVPLLAEVVGVRSGLITVDGVPITDSRKKAEETDDLKIYASTTQADDKDLTWRNGSRKLTLNDYLIKRVSGLRDLGDVLEAAHTLNDETFSKLSKGPLDIKTLELVAKTVWVDHLKNPKAIWTGGYATAQMMPWEASGEVYPDDVTPGQADTAHRLLTYLRVCHGARPDRAFQFAVKSMAQKNLIKGWGKDKYLTARRALEKAGLLVKVRNASTGKAALYKLTPARMHPLARLK